MIQPMKTLLILLSLFVQFHVNAQEVDTPPVKNIESFDSQAEGSDIELLRSIDKDIGSGINMPVEELVDKNVQHTLPVVETVDPDFKLNADANSDNELKKIDTTEVKDELEKALKADDSVKVVNKSINGKDVEIFETGIDEKKVYELAKFIENKISDNEWNKLISKNSSNEYIIEEGEYLWKISQKLFGTGFYYPKLWALNPYITNPHEVKPGMILMLSEGSVKDLPEIKFANFEPSDVNENSSQGVNYNKFGDFKVPQWLKERESLRKNGAMFMYANEYSYEDLNTIAENQLNSEYKQYDPPIPDYVLTQDLSAYDDTGFDRTSIVKSEFKEGFYLNSFVTTNYIQDLGNVEASSSNNKFLSDHNSAYLKFDESVSVMPGDKFSIYAMEGEVEHDMSDRTGHRYTIIGHVQALNKKEGTIWECEIISNSSIIHRLDRVTVYTPKIERIVKTFNDRKIDAMIVSTYVQNRKIIAYGDVAYLDRGRVDGVEIGNVFEVYDNIDHGTDKKITNDPTYKVGELTVINLTDNFSTVLVTNSSNNMRKGLSAFTKTKDQALLANRIKSGEVLKDVDFIEKNALEELDVELHLDDISEDLLRKADQVEISDDEMDQLEKLEQEKSIINEHESDLKALEQLEKEILDAEKSLDEAKVDEDKYLEQTDLNKLEKKMIGRDPNKMAPINNLEKEIGKKYMDEKLKTKDNPYGLTEYDIEEIDELVNSTDAKVKHEEVVPVSAITNSEEINQGNKDTEQNVQDSSEQNFLELEMQEEQ